MADYGASLNSQEDIALHTYTAGSLSPMMANAPFSSGAPSLLEDLKGWVHKGNGVKGFDMPPQRAQTAAKEQIGMCRKRIQYIST